MKKRSKTWDEVKARRFSKQQQAAIQARALTEVLQMRLAELRKELGVTQEQLAEYADMNQSELSRIEHRDDHRLSTLRRYVRALGGRLEVTAVVGSRRVQLLDV